VQVSAYRDDSIPSERPVLVVAFRGRIFGLSRASGQILWEVMHGAGPPELLITSDRVYAVGGPSLLVLEYPSGREIRRVLLEATFGGRSRLLLDGGHLFVGVGGEAFCLTRDGDLLWKQPFEGKGVADVALGFPGNVRQVDVVG
jgi:outer membrane protein assembly factor BamB